MILYSGCKSDKNEFKKIVLAEALWIVYQILNCKMKEFVNLGLNLNIKT